MTTIETDQQPERERPASARADRQYVQHVHVADPGYLATTSELGAISVANYLYFDGVKVMRRRGEWHRPYPTDPAHMLSRDHGVMETLGLWSAGGGRTRGTHFTFWCAAGDVEVEREEPDDAVRVRVCGRDILIPGELPPPVVGTDPLMPVQITMFVGRFTVGAVPEGWEAGMWQHGEWVPSQTPGQ